LIEISEELRIIIVLLNDLSGGIIKLGEVCSINRIKYNEDFEVRYKIKNHKTFYSYSSTTFLHMDLIMT
jgi:hypothetical protein